MREASHPRHPPFALVLVGSYVLAAASAAVTAITWIEGFLWVGGVLCVAWLALVGWAFSEFRARAAWALLGLIILNPLTIIYAGLHYTCAVNFACL